MRFGHDQEVLFKLSLCGFPCGFFFLFFTHLHSDLGVKIGKGTIVVQAMPALFFPPIFTFYPWEFYQKAAKQIQHVHHVYSVQIAAGSVKQPYTKNLS